MHYVESSFKSYPAAVDIAAGSAVKLVVTSGVTYITTAAAATDKIIGVIQSKVKTGFTTDVRLRSASGTLAMVVGAGGAIALGDAVTSDAAGLAVTTVTTGNQIIGYAVEAAAVGKVVELLPSTAKV